MEEIDLGFWPTFQAQQSKSASIDAVAIDSRAISSQKTLFVALKGSQDDGHFHVKSALDNGARFALVNEDWPIPPDVDSAKIIPVPSSLHALQDLAAWYREQLPVCLVAVVGSCGKTMLKDLLGHLFEGKAYTSPESYNSQLGVALSLLNIPKKSSLAFIEMAATKSGEMRRLVSMTKPSMVLVTNFRNRSFATEKMGETVAEEIVEMLHQLPSSSLALVEELPSIDLSSLQSSWHGWNRKSQNLPWIEQTGIEKDNLFTLCCTFPDKSKKSISLPIEHAYLQNLLSLALQAAWKLGLSPPSISKALDSYTPNSMRTEIWKNKRGVTCINSTYCHTPLSLDASLSEIMKERRGKSSLVVGGSTDFSRYAKEIVASATRHNISSLFAWPEPFAQALRQYKKETLSFTTKERAVQAAQSSDSNTIIFKGSHKLPIEWLLKEMEGIPQATISINLAAIRTNLERIKKLLPQETSLMIMVKASAYGTDSVLMADFLQSCGITMLGVSHVDEGEYMRQMGVEQRIFVIHAAEFEMEKAASNNLEIGISTLSQIHAACKAAREQKTTIKVHLNVDTGLKRFGCLPSEAFPLAHAIESAPELNFEGIFTHFSSADDPEKDGLTYTQAKELSSIIDTIESKEIHPKYRHASNSAAALRFRFEQFNMVRIGLAPFGLLPSSSITLRPALSLSTSIVNLTTARKGERVGYGGTHLIEHEEARLAIIPIGYHDGLHRSYSNAATVQVRGQAAPIIGKICMDFTIVDVTDIPNVAVGDTVRIFGEDEFGRYHSPETFAQSGGTIVNELMTSLGPRIKRLFVYDESIRS